MGLACPVATTAQRTAPCGSPRPDLLRTFLDRPSYPARASAAAPRWALQDSLGSRHAVNFLPAGGGSRGPNLDARWTHGIGGMSRLTLSRPVMEDAFCGQWWVHQRGNIIARVPPTRTGAKRVERGGVSVKEGDSLDGDLKAGLNEMSNEAIRVMLSGDIQQIMSFKDKVDSVGEFLVGEEEIDAARFMLVLRGMLEHEVVPETELLEGPYRKAYEKIGSLVEDSGWLLAPPNTEGGGVEMVDDELIPPVLRSSYN